MILHWWHVVNLKREMMVVKIKNGPKQGAKTKESVGIVERKVI